MFRKIWKAMSEEKKNESGFEQPSTEALAEVKMVTINTEEFEDFKAQAAKGIEYLDRLQRLAAEFENFKKRAARERQDAIRFANESLLGRLIPVLDNFEMALAAANQASENSTDSLKTGVEMIAGQFKNVIIEAGLEEIDAAGKPFDPNLHEAVSQQETADIPEGHVLLQLRKGYKLKERLIRPATVIVSKTPTA
ncbi:MAG: nucleotide exchange factor GrpE [Pedosphaera sp.]|nr:nucleotide exchange factor GrpE [Pedosphaera sp.]MST00984.1 nucleotide exchange factor GrpE [Pedosphaera sp.]